MKTQKTIDKINSILKTDDYRGIPRDTIVNLDDAEEIAYLIRHKIVCRAGGRCLVMAY